MYKIQKIIIFYDHDPLFFNEFVLHRHQDYLEIVGEYFLAVFYTESHRVSIINNDRS